jgi:hypothetical protein
MLRRRAQQRLLFLELEPAANNGLFASGLSGSDRRGASWRRAEQGRRCGTQPLIDVSCFTDSDRESGHLGINAMGQSTKALSFSPLRGSKSGEAGSPVEGMVKGARYHEMD